MGFSSVYKVLQDVFPQVDSRLLKAVAIEHSKDADAAVEVVLVEILPNLPEKPLAVGSSSKGKSPISFFEGGSGETSHVESTMDHLVVNSYHQQTPSEARVFSSIDGTFPAAKEDAASSPQVKSLTVTEPVNLEPLATSSNNDADVENVSVVSPISLEEFLIKNNISINHASGYSDNTGQGSETVEVETVSVPVSDQLVDEISGTDFATHEAVPTSSKSASEKEAFTVEFVDSDNESGTGSMLTSSQEKCSTVLLEEIIEEAKNDKKVLLAAMSSVVDLMREVELKEKAAEQANEEVTNGCSDILSKVDEVKQALIRAKEANDMHGGEVNAEKSILTTELKELQLRLFTLSDETKRSLGVLDEMRKALEARLAAALDDIEAAKERKLEHERTAREALVYQESQMEKVVEESKKLKLEAEENSKLQEFLMDRGRAIDVLQGEIYVKCQDVLLLKEKFDKRIPLSKSLSSSQMSSVLASSGLSFRSVVTPLETVTPFEPEVEPETETFESIKRSLEMGESYGFLGNSSRSDDASQSNKSPEETVVDPKMLLEDGWDFLEN